MDADLSQETLAAFVDGELPPKDMERVAALLAERPDMQRYVRSQEQLRSTLRGAFAEVSDQAPPMRLVQAARTAPVSRRWRLRYLLQRELSWRALVPLGATLAVGLAIGVVLRPNADLSTNASGQLVARGSLGRALEQRLASAGYPGSGPRIGISFRDKAGEDCRTFTDGSASGLACHRNGAWMISTLVNQSPSTPGYVYRMAGSEMPDAVRRAVTASIVGAPFDAQTERAARNSGWK